MSEQNANPWYREFWAWFVLAPLILIVLVCSVLISVAVSQRDDLVVDDYYKVGKMINQEFAPEQEAQRLAVEAQLTIDIESGELFVDLNQSGPALLSLEFSHPSDSSLDMVTILRSADQKRYRADIEALEPSRWYVRLNAITEDDEVIWRLKGELNFAASTTATLEYRR